MTDDDGKPRKVSYFEAQPMGGRLIIPKRPKDDRTAGQVAYEAFMQERWGHPGDWIRGASVKQKASWEVSAKAVLDAAGGLVDLDGLVDDGFEGPG
ncbi:MAG: hypothetical protein O7G84_00950 [Gammaproteobacteria bacterium]|nr:hypothetical protein [Gammaproteobacteria bacterium]